MGSEFFGVSPAPALLSAVTIFDFPFRRASGLELGKVPLGRPRALPADPRQHRASHLNIAGNSGGGIVPHDQLGGCLIGAGPAHDEGSCRLLPAREASLGLDDLLGAFDRDAPVVNAVLGGAAVQAGQASCM